MKYRDIDKQLEKVVIQQSRYIIRVVIDSIRRELKKELKTCMPKEAKGIKKVILLLESYNITLYNNDKVLWKRG